MRGGERSYTGLVSEQHGSGTPIGNDGVAGGTTPVMGWAETEHDVM